MGHVTTEIDILKRARSLIEKPERWTQGAAARKECGDTCNAADIRAVCFCALGAIERALADVGVVGDVARRTRAMIGPTHGSVVMWNDAPERTHAEVLASFDAAIHSMGEP
jgi:hypothetical protein